MQATFPSFRPSIPSLSSIVDRLYHALYWLCLYSPTLLWLTVFCCYQCALTPATALLSGLALMSYLGYARMVGRLRHPNYCDSTQLGQTIGAEGLALIYALAASGLTLLLSPQNQILINPVFGSGIFISCYLAQQALTTVVLDTELLWLFGGYQLAYLLMAQPLSAAVLTVMTLSFTQLAKHINGGIDIQWKEQNFDPFRTLINQFCRLFSGALIDPIAGRYTRKVKPLLQLGGIALNMLNSLLSLSIRPGSRPVYTAISWSVLVLSCLALSKILLNHGGALLLGVPVSLIGGLIQLSAECIELINRELSYIYLCKTVMAPSQEDAAAKNARLDTFIRQKQSIRRKKLSNIVTVLISSLSWMPFLAPQQLASLSVPQLLGIAGLGLFITFVNFFQDRLFKDFLALDDSPALKQRQRSSVELDIQRLQTPMHTFNPQEEKPSQLAMWSNHLWSQIKTVGYMVTL